MDGEYYGDLEPPKIQKRGVLHFLNKNTWWSPKRVRKYNLKKRLEWILIMREILEEAKIYKAKKRKINNSPIVPPE